MPQTSPLPQIKPRQQSREGEDAGTESQEEGRTSAQACRWMNLTWKHQILTQCLLEARHRTRHWGRVGVDACFCLKDKSSKELFLRIYSYSVGPVLAGDIQNAFIRFIHFTYNFKLFVWVSRTDSPVLKTYLQDVELWENIDRTRDIVFVIF